MKKTLLALGLFFSPHALFAQAWTNMGIGGGGAQFAPSFSALDSTLLFLQCDMGGIYRSTNNGTNFTMVDFTQFGSSTDYPNGSCPIGYDPNNVNNLWAYGGQADDTGGSLLKSTDEGIHWSYATQPPWGNSYRITRIVIDRGNSNFIILGADSGAFYSTNGGTSWNTCTGVDGYVWDIVIDQSSPIGNRTVYIGSDVDAAAGTGGGVFKGTNVNSGGAFLAANTGLPGAALTGFSGASVSSPATVVLYAVYDAGGGTYSGTDLYRSVNGAANWTLAYAGSNTDGFNKVECAEASPATAYAINNAQSSTEGVWKTTNYGATWNNVFTPAKGSGNVTLGWVDWDILFQEGAAWIQLKVNPANPNLVVATDLDTSYQTTDGGATWSEIYSTFADTPPIGSGKKWATRNLEVTTAWHYYINPWTPTTHYICQSDIGLQRSSDSGNTWYHSLPFSVTWHNTIYEMAFDSGTHTIYAAASSQHDICHSTQIRVGPGAGGVLKSTDDGATWAPVTTGLPGTPATSILRDGSGNLYVAIWGNSAANGGVFKSTNNGGSWTAMNTGLGNSPNYHAYQLKMDNSGNLYCLISGYNIGVTWTSGGIWKLPSGGSNWTYLTANGDGAGVPLYYLQGFDMDSSGTTIYAASMKYGSPSQKGMYRSINGGASWTHMVTTFTGTANPIDGFCPSVNPNNASDVYLGTENEGLWESLDAGNTWNRITGVPFRNTHRITFDTLNNTLYLTTFGSSVWKLVTGSTSIPTATLTATMTSSLFTATSTPTKTPTSTPSSTASTTPTQTRTNTPSPSPTPSATPTATLNNTPTCTNTPTASFTTTNTDTPTITSTPTNTQTGTVPPSNTPTLTPTNTWTVTPTNTAAATVTSTFTNTVTKTDSFTPTWTPTPTPSNPPSSTPTFTPSRTGTSTPSNTPSGLSTFTRTPTATLTPGPQAIGTVLIYPNPGPGPVSIQINLSQASNDLVITLFSTAFRKVNEVHFGPKPSGSLVLPMGGTDEWNNPLANGLYYVVVRTSQKLLIGKWVVLR